MGSGGGVDGGEARIPWWKSRGDSFKHPGTAKVESIKMRKFRIRRIGDDRRLEPFRGAVGTNWRHELRQPYLIFLGGEHATNHVGFAETWREEVLAGRFVGHWTIA